MEFVAQLVGVSAGLIPLLGAPMGGANSEAMLAEAVGAAVRRGLVRAKQHVVCVLSVRGDFMLKVVSVDDVGGGMAHSISSSGQHMSLSGTQPSTPGFLHSSSVLAAVPTVRGFGSPIDYSRSCSQ